MAEQEYKQCGKCRKAKPLSEFHRRVASSDGLQSSCIPCRKEWDKLNPEKRYEYTRQYRRRNRAKQAAQWRVWDAIKRGKLTKPKHCEDCGQQVQNLDRLQGHHHDYSKPLDVEWLCPQCHKNRHYPS
jgi:hypothetical protein